MKDPLMDMVHQARAKLLKEYGGMDGLFKYLKKLERRQALRIKKHKARPSGTKKSAAVTAMTNDENVERIDRVGNELIKLHGGLSGYIKYLQEMDRQRSLDAKKRKKPAKRRPKAVKQHPGN